MALAASSDAQRNPRFARPKREAYNTATGHVQSSLQSRYNTVIGIIARLHQYTMPSDLPVVVVAAFVLYIISSLPLQQVSSSVRF